MAPRALLGDQQSKPIVTTFQIDDYERGRLKSFPPRVAPKRRVIRFNAATTCHHSPSESSHRCLEREDPSAASTISANGITVNIYPKIYPRIGGPELSLKFSGIAKEGLRRRM